jgi:subfamily B ATP-binding cassette protein HlyB/CyaB
MLARLHNIEVSDEGLTREFGNTGTVAPKSVLLLAAGKLGLRARLVKTTVGRLAQTPLPAIALGRDGSCFLIAKQHQDKVLVHDPKSSQAEILDLAALDERWSGQLILARPQEEAVSMSVRFDFTWFIPAVIKYRRLLGEVLASSFALQIFALATPLFFQVVMDKVLVHQAYTTLNVIAVGLLAVVLFETALSALRSYVFTHTASRIDVELGARLFQHLVNLPLAYFQARRVGDSVARVKELENIRAFLTGGITTLLIDVCFSVAFLAVMAVYSGWLTLVVLLSLPFYILISVVITPLLRARLQDNFTRSAENHAFLVETVNGIDTIKSMAVEHLSAQRWDQQLAAYVSASFKAQNLAMVANESVGLIGKLVTVVTLWLGARLVIDGTLSIGELVAFNMLSGRIAQPVMRLAQLWTSVQQTGVSMQRLGDILNTPTELSNKRRPTLPRVVGNIQFEQVRFRYRPDRPEVLHDISLHIHAGEVIGVIGRSGSGKSTLAKLLQRLYVPEKGRILVDGFDITTADVASLRHQIGVVLQDNLLFNRSIRDNIALAEPATQLEAIAHAAHMAGAHDFITDLPEGYETMVGEHGASLSGGQRQRIAIARALLGDPRILVFDEATSALDYESERIIHDNMASICQGRTVIIIAHRLSAVRYADRIVVMDAGRIVEQGVPAELLANQDSYYARFQAMQRI